jgi:hypothetical protein
MGSIEILPNGHLWGIEALISGNGWEAGNAVSQKLSDETVES